MGTHTLTHQMVGKGISSTGASHRTRTARPCGLSSGRQCVQSREVGLWSVASYTLLHTRSVSCAGMEIMTTLVVCSLPQDQLAHCDPYVTEVTELLHLLGLVNERVTPVDPTRVPTYSCVLLSTRSVADCPDKWSHRSDTPILCYVHKTQPRHVHQVQDTCELTAGSF